MPFRRIVERNTSIFEKHNDAFCITIELISKKNCKIFNPEEFYGEPGINLLALEIEEINSAVSRSPPMASLNNVDQKLKFCENFDEKSQKIRSQLQLNNSATLFYL